MLPYPGEPEAPAPKSPTPRLGSSGGGDEHEAATPEVTESDENAPEMGTTSDGVSGPAQ